MTKIKNLKDEMMLFEKVMDNNNLETTKSLTHNFTSVYYFIFSDKTTTPLIYPIESNKLLVFFKFIVQDSDFDLLGLFQFADFLTKSFVNKNLIEL